jgi:hypothetical protein
MMWNDRKEGDTAGCIRDQSDVTRIFWILFVVMPVMDSSSDFTRVAHPKVPGS